MTSNRRFTVIPPSVVRLLSPTSDATARRFLPDADARSPQARSGSRGGTRNTLISQRRTERRRPATAELADDLAGGRATDDPAESVEIRQVYAAIADLADEFREALVAVDIVGLSYQEAARALGVPEGTLTSRLFRARDRVARRMSGARGLT
jgi:predicted DNA-binding protein (UPF0251 family)